MVHKDLVMRKNNDNLKSFGQNIQRLIKGEDLGREQVQAMFGQVLRNEQSELQQGAFLAALTAKGETIEEIAGAWSAIDSIDTVKVDEMPSVLVENSGTGMDNLKTFNVSSAAAVVAAAGGVVMARHGARALTSSCGTVDIMEQVGIDVECNTAMVGDSIRKVGIGLFNGMSPNVHPGALTRILAGIRFGSTLNIAASLASPVSPSHGLRGVYAETLVEPTARLMMEIGYRRGMVVHGRDDLLSGGMDEISITGSTIVAEFDRNGSIRKYELRPEELGLQVAGFQDIAASGDMETEAIRFIRILAGDSSKALKACRDITCLNAGAIFYLTGMAEDLADGVAKSGMILEKGEALDKLREWVACQNRDPKLGLKRLNQLLVDAGMKTSHE